jgi:sorbitol-specific phosphotransferase system component IIA
MKPSALFVLLLGATLVLGCNTYHYYDITVMSQSPVTVTETSGMNVCTLVVSGAASDALDLSMTLGCPPSGSNIGTFEYATFADSGNITFTFNGYSQQIDPGMLCTSNKVTLPADGTITQTGMISLTSFDETVCPPHVTTGTP